MEACSALCLDFWLVHVLYGLELTIERRACYQPNLSLLQRTNMSIRICAVSLYTGQKCRDFRLTSHRYDHLV